MHSTAVLSQTESATQTALTTRGHSVLKTSILFTVVTTILFGLGYPLLITGLAAVMFPHKAGGSLILKDGQVIGSELLAQSFTSDRYFHPRPSAAGNGWDATSSSGTNLGPTSAKLANGSHAKDASGKDVNDPGNFDGIKDLVAAYRASNGLKDTVPVPADAVTRSGSGLDPHISLANAELQAPRVARARGLPLARVRGLIDENTAGRDLGVLGEAGVNVLLLNAALDRIPSGK